MNFRIRFYYIFFYIYICILYRESMTVEDMCCLEWYENIKRKRKCNHLPVAIKLHQFLNPNTAAQHQVNISTNLWLWLVQQKTKEVNSDTFSVKYTSSSVACGRLLHCLNHKLPLLHNISVFIMGTFMYSLMISLHEQHNEKRWRFLKKEKGMSFVLN